MNCSPQLNDRARSRRPKPSEGRAFTARGVGSAAFAGPWRGAGVGAAPPQFSALLRGATIVSAGLAFVLCPSPVPRAPRGAAAAGFSRGLGGRPEGFLGDQAPPQRA